MPARDESAGDTISSIVPRTLSVVIVTWNSSGCIHDCLSSLEGKTSDIEVIIVDNDSHDGTQEIVEKHFPWVRLISNSHNAGYAHANNQGIAESSGDYLLFLNPDTIVNDRAIPALMTFMKSHDEAGALAPQLINPDGTVQQSCREFPTWQILLWEFTGFSRIFSKSRLFARWRMGYFDHRSMREVDQPMASCLLVPRGVLEAVGVFDERFPMFMNDVDLCYRIKKGGWCIVFFPEASVVHRLGESTERVKKQMIISSHRSIYHYFKKHHPTWTNEILGAFLVIAALIRIARLKLRPKGAKASHNSRTRTGVSA